MAVRSAVQWCGRPFLRVLPRGCPIGVWPVFSARIPCLLMVAAAFAGLLGPLVMHRSACIAAPRTSIDAVSEDDVGPPPSTLPMTIEAIADPTDFRLPNGASVRVTIRYASGNPAAHQRAIELERGLSEQGLEVSDFVASTEQATANAVSYFYAEDRLSAEIAAHGLGPEWRLVQRRIGRREPLPRPGALELTVTGP